MSELPPCRHEKLSLESVGYAIGHWVCECGWSSDANCLPEVNKQLAALRADLAEAMAILEEVQTPAHIFAQAPDCTCGGCRAAALLQKHKETRA